MIRFLRQDKDPSGRGGHIRHRIIFTAVFMLILEVSASARTAGIPLRFPVLSNPNAVAGRLYLQPLGEHDDQAIEPLTVSADFGSATDYNVHFVEKEGDRELTVNTNIYSFAVTKGFSLFGKSWETGTQVRLYQDMRQTWGSELVKNYHEAFPSDGFGHVPPDGQFYGCIGDNQTPVIGNNREFYLTTVQLHAKTQILRDQPGRPIPDLALKLTARIPTSGKPFDTQGIGLTAGLSKQLTASLSFMGSAALVYQALSEEDFNANNLTVEPLAVDLFAGACWDMGLEDGWYAQGGLRWSSERVAYKDNSESAGPAYVVHFGPVYRSQPKRWGFYEYFISFSEDIPGLGYGLEPDVAFFTGLAFSFTNR